MPFPASSLPSVSVGQAGYPFNTEGDIDVSVEDLYANEAALSAASFPGGSSLPDGAIAYVGAHLSLWLLRTQALAVSAGTVIASSIAGKQWVRMPISHPFWATQTAWGIDASAGSDENVGSVALPIRTLAELWRRLGYGAECLIAQVTAFTFVGNFAVTDPLKLNLRITGTGTYLRFSGTVTASVAAGGSGDVVARTNLARPTLADFTGQAGLSALMPNSTTAANGRVTITSGASAGASFWLARDMTGDKIETSPPMTYGAIPNSGIGTLATITAGAGNNYQLETLSRIDASAVTIRADQTGGPPSANAVYFTDLDLGFSSGVGAGLIGIGSTIQAIYQGCVIGQLSGVEFRNGGLNVFNNCRFNRSNTTSSGQHWILAGVTIGAGSVTTFQTGAQCNYDLDHLMQATRLRTRQYSQARIGTLCIQNATGDAFTVEGDALDAKCLNIAGTAHLLYGAGNSGVGFKAGSGRGLFYVTTKPTVTGTGGDTTIGSAAVTAWAATPLVYATNNAQVSLFF